MKRYRVCLIRYKDFEHFVIYLSADCISCAYYKAYELLKNSYGNGAYSLISVYEE